MTGDRPLLVILGATATGKTQLSIELARQFNGEIISADSRQVYRYMDIGTAKATPEQRADVPHHLIDIVEPDISLALAEYQEMAYAAINRLHQQNKLPILAGGTGQYITAVTEGWAIPQVAPDEALREQMQAVANAQGAKALHEQLAQVDPEAAQKIHPNNVRRVIRALEVHELTGRPITELQRKQPPPYRILTLGLQMAREALYARADARVDQMIADGFVEEVRDLLARGYHRDLPSMSGLGYLELSAHILDGLPLADAITRTKNSTHHFIRRQDLWFRGHDHNILWHNSSMIGLDSVQAQIAGWLEN